MKSPVVKRSIVIAGHKTSVSLEDAFWKALKDIAVAQHTTLSDLVATIDSERRLGNLSSAIRLFVLEHFQARAESQADSRHDEDGRASSTPAAGAQTPPAMMALAPATAPAASQPES
jgi:predicted DNA-binding ribbon-helix-helix protein